jgi:DNA invertase Pin-like site-specific DNA recombinase
MTTQTRADLHKPQIIHLLDAAPTRQARDNGQCVAGDFSRESKGRGGPIDTQQEENAEHADDNGWPLLLRVSDEVSASSFGTKARVGWPVVHEWVRDELIDVLILWEISRGDRISDTWVPFLTLCALHGVKIYVTNETTLYDPNEPSHRARLINAGTDAELESAKNSKRSKKGVRRAAKEGKGHGPATYGYTRIYDQRDRRIWEDKIDPMVAPHVIFIITSIGQRKSIGWIQRALFARGAYPPAIQRKLDKLDKGETLTPDEMSQRWDRTTISRLAEKVAYLGLRSHRSLVQRRKGEPGSLHVANWPPISDAPDWEETFYRAQAVLNEPQRKRAAAGKTRHLLSYIATAHDCAMGGRMSMQTRRDAREIRYRCLDNSCLSISGPDLEEWIVRLIMERLSDPAVRGVFTSDDVLSAAQADVTRLDLELAKARDLWANGRVSDDAFAAKEGVLMPQLATARARIAASTSANAVLTLLGEGTFTAVVGRPRWEAMSMAARRSVVKTLFERIEVAPSRGVVTPRKAIQDKRLALVDARVTVTWRGALAPTQVA